MSHYKPPLKDQQFVIEHLAGLDQVNALPGFEDATPDLVEAIIEQAGRFASEVFEPINRSGDQQGARLLDGKVEVPEGFADAYQAFVDNGWQGIDQPVEYDGQGMPYLIQAAVSEIWNSTNMALTLCPLLTGGAILAIHKHASEALKQTYLPLMVTGTWSGTMNLTEPQAGSDLSAITTRAEPDGDHYRIRGQKIYITYGEHEMSENIVHLVLARLPDAPAGVKGISLFLVPKYLVNEDGSLGPRNDLRVVSLEHKLGIHASPTCVMSYGDHEGAIGYLVGEPHNGLACMFTMMNHARLEVGMEGVGLSARAYQHALAYAGERVQGSRPNQPDRVTIIHHPDVRRMLMQMRAITEASRALAYWAAAVYDHAEREPAAEVLAFNHRRLELLTPIVKTWCTELAQEVAYLGIQIHGGMGFVEETGAAQYYRDARITTIYEGTTGIQAMDFIGRKVLRDQGKALTELSEEMKTIGSCSDSGDARVNAMIGRVVAQVDLLETTSAWVIENVTNDPDLAGAVAVELLMMSGYVTGGWLMVRAALAASSHIAAGSNDPFYANKINTALFYCEHILPRCNGLAESIRAGSASVMGIDVARFDEL